MFEQPETPKEAIPGIFNYCDRWCERCPLTSRCHLFAEEAQSRQAGTDDSRLWEQLAQSFAKAEAIIRAHVEESGGDWDAFVREAENTPPQEAQLSLEEEALLQASRQYISAAHTWFSTRSAWFEQWNEQLNQQAELGIDVQAQAQRINEAVEVIQWYQFMVSTKTQRALQGQHDAWLMEEFPIQNDANGSARLALLAIVRSIAAWETIRQEMPDETDTILDLLLVLSRIQKTLEQRFPQVGAFVRPGFDEPAYQEEIAQYHRGALPLDPYQQSPDSKD